MKTLIALFFLSGFVYMIIASLEFKPTSTVGFPHTVTAGLFFWMIAAVLAICHWL